MDGATARLTIDRPLRLGEVLAAAIRAYGARAVTLVSIGLLQVGAFLLAFVVPWFVALPTLALAFVLAFALVARVAEGDTLAMALRVVGRRLPVLTLLAFIVGVPFSLIGFDPLFIIVGVLWIAVAGFAVPDAVLHEQPGLTLWERTATVLRRTAALAQTDFGHALAVSVTLVLLYLLFGNLLVAALFSFADQGEVAAPAVVQAVLAPFFFLGLTVLYHDQLLRAEGRSHRKAR